MIQATNASTMRLSNRKLILDLIRMQPISRAELAEQAHLTRASITVIVDELISAGLVEEISAVERNALGRKRVLLSLCHRARYAFGVNIRRECCYVGVIDLYGEVLAEKRIRNSSHSSAAEQIDRIAEVIEQQRQELKLSSDRILGIGISAPGPVEYREGTILNPPNFSAWHNLPVCRMLEDRTGLNAYLEKDTSARALEELYFGAARQSSNFLLVQVDDGVGCGVVIHGKLFRGASGRGNEIGHTSICYNGPVCSCGNRGCLENYLRIPSLLKDTRFASWTQLAACDGQEDASALLDRAAEYLSAALTSVINLYDLELILLSGDVALAPEPLLTRLNDRLRSRVLNRISTRSIPVAVSSSNSHVRCGAMAMLHSLFQDR